MDTDNICCFSLQKNDKVSYYITGRYVTYILRLIQRFLKDGVVEAGIESETDSGTPQGGVISPILANVYLHYVLDLWFTVKIKQECRGEAYIVRYADDFVCFFQYKSDAETFYVKLIERLGKFNLEIA